MEANLKQRYLHANSPQPHDFDAERNRVFQQLMVLLSSTDRKEWMSTGFNCGSLIDNFKQVYGLTNHEFEAVIMLLTNIALVEEGLNTETRVLTLRTINTLAEYQIKITDNLRLSNRKLIGLLQKLAGQGVEGTLRHLDEVVNELSKFTFYFCKFGEEVIDEALSLAIEYGDIRYLLIFLRSLKSQDKAEMLLVELFSDNNLWDRDGYWFYILSEIVKHFPRIDYSPHYQTIMQETIRAFTAIIEGLEEDVKKVVSPDSFLQIQPILKSVAVILANLMLPQSQPQHYFVKSCLERVFILVTSSLDYISPPDYIFDLLSFAKAYVRAYLLRHRAERGRFKLWNEDYLEDCHQEKEGPYLVDEAGEQFFDSLWQEIIPRVVYFEDPEQLRPSKLVVQLCIYKPEKLLGLTLRSLLAVISRQDPTLISLHGSKVTLLFLQEFIIRQHPEELSIYLQCCSQFLSLLSKVPIAENLDAIELVVRSYIFFSQKQLEEVQVQSLSGDIIDLLLQEMDAIEIGLEGTDNQQAELYIDFSNIFFPFFLKIDQQNLSKFTEKFIYRLVNKIPEHRQTYLNIVTALVYREPTFCHKVAPHIFKSVLSSETQGNKEWQFLTNPGCELHCRNENALKWYSCLLQCLFQYHPKNVIKFWPEIKRVANVLLGQWEEMNYLDLGLDIIFNVVLCLCKHHLPYTAFIDDRNAWYTTLHLEWQLMTPEAKALLDDIVDEYYFKVEKYLRNKYQAVLDGNSKDTKVLQDFESFIERQHGQDTVRIRRRNLRLVDLILMGEVASNEESLDRKIIYRALSVQYTLLSSLLYRAPLHPNSPDVGNGLTQDKYRYFRRNACEYLEWVLQLLGHFSLLAEESYVRLFNYFWRQAHDQVCYSAVLTTTADKLEPYYFSQIHRKKQLLRAPFLVVNEAYLNHMLRQELELLLVPTAHLNHSRYFESNFTLSISPFYEHKIFSSTPPGTDTHQHNREIVAILRYHMDTNNPEGYLSRYLVEKDPGTKQRLNTAFKSLVITLKRLMNVFSDASCMADEFIRNTVLDVVALIPVMPQKKDRLVIYQIIYMWLVFSFDPFCLKTTEEYSVSRYWALKAQNDPQAEQYEILSVGRVPGIDGIVRGTEEVEMQRLEAYTRLRGMRLTRSCSFAGQDEINRQIDRVVTELIKRIKEREKSPEKDKSVYLLMLLQFSNTLPLSNPLIGQLLQLLFHLCSIPQSGVFEMSKTGLFHLINRFNYNQRKVTRHSNTPVRRSWEDFLKYKYLGGEGVDYRKVKLQKSEYHFYPNGQIMAYDYATLGSDATADTHANQLILLSLLENEDWLLHFVRNCKEDKELKTELTDDQASVGFTFESISSNAHRLMHFVWDCNPEKTALFIGLMERYASYPLNFYSRLFRKIFRIGGEKVKRGIARLAETFRKGEPEEMRLSCYLSCELIMDNPADQMHQPFLNFLEECTKDDFNFVLLGFYNIFTSNFVLARENYRVVIDKLRQFKGAPRLRHLQMLNTYVLAQGRFAREAVLEATEMFLKDITEGGDEVSEAVVSMITECYVQAINLKNIQDWVSEPLQALVKDQKVYVLNDHVGYNNSAILTELMQELLRRAKQEESQEGLSDKLRVYCQIVRKIMSSINIFRFNDYFYNLLKECLLFILDRPQPLEEDAVDHYVISQLCASEYPEEIYSDLLGYLVDMKDCTQYVIKKRLAFIEGMVLHRSFRLNRAEIPPVLSLNEKQITFEHIMAVSNMARLMKADELTAEAERLAGTRTRKKHETYLLLAVLIASGVREYEWKEQALKELTKSKKDKLVKEGISAWWKGKTPQTEQEMRLGRLVGNFDNPYNYFA